MNNNFANLLNLQKNEPLLKDEVARFTTFQLNIHKYGKHMKIIKMHFGQLKRDYTADKEDWEKLSDDERYFIEHILAFFGI